MQKKKNKLPHEQHMVTLFMNIPTDIQRLGAANQAVKTTQQLLVEAKQEQDDDSNVHRGGTSNYDSDDSDDLDDLDDSIGEIMGSYSKFIYSLQDCPMILGFHAVMTHEKAHQCCHCPCSKTLQPWREYHNIDIPTCAAAQKYDPNGFVAHLNAVGDPKNINDNGTGKYHRMVLRYLNALYQNYWGPNIHHRGLYVVGTTEEKKGTG